MKKNLRLLCLGLAAATFTTGFAQAENVTDKLKNADMEKGVIGWTIDFDSHIWKKNTKNQAAKRGFHGVTNTVVENWKSDASSGLSDNSISQTVTNLPNGTYVFGAYIGASMQGTPESNRETITGVTLFANEGTTAVATDNPDNSGAKWAHTAKFNVAATVTDGTLNVGLKAETTNANYLIMDNATLYYFGNMDAAAALDEMAKIDLAATLAIADTCLVHKMNADSLDLIHGAIEAAEAVTTADAAWQADEDLYWSIYKANKSAADYRSFNNAIVAAEVVAAGEWNPAVAKFLDALNANIGTAKATYTTATADRIALNEQKAVLNESAALVALDSCYLVLDYELPEILEALEADDKIGDEPGQYTEEKINQIYDLMEEARIIVDEAYAYEVTAIQARHIYDSLYVAIQNVLNNPNSIDSFPFTITTSQEANAEGRYEYTSKTYKVAFPVTNLRFTFKDVFCPNGAGKGNPPFVALGEFYLYDGDGEPIELSADNFNTNAQETTEGGMENICDGDDTSFWHSAWSSTPTTDFHYLEVSIPDGLELTSFSFGWIDRGSNKQNIPLVVEVSSVSEASSMLESAVNTAKLMNAFAGTDPGFYNADLSAFWNAIAAGEAVLENGGTDEEMYAAIGELETQQGLVDEMKVNMPVEGKKYHLVIGYDGFYAHQGVQKALYARGDSVVWWQTAGADSIGQEFVLESIGVMEDETPIYKVLNVHTNRYLVLDTEGNHVALTADKAEADTVKLVSLGAGAFNLQATDGSAIHAGDHNSGSPSTSAGAYGGIYGISSGLCFYDGGFNSASAWFVREMHALPYTATVAAADYRSETFHLYSGVNTLVLTADKACAFTDLTVYDLWGNVVAAEVNAAGNAATLMFEETIESFSVMFKNNEGVTSLVVNGSVTKLSELQTAYDETVAINPEAGDAVGQYSDLDEYNAAIAAAEALLANGGSDEEIEKAIAALDSAVVHLQINLPLADKTYFILSAYDAFEETHGVEMALYVKNEAPAWSYVGTSGNNYLWKFVQKEELVYGQPAFYLQHVATGTYMGSADYLSTALTMVADTASTKPFHIDAWGDGIVTIRDARYNNANLHFNGHSNGAGAYGNVVYWSATVGTASAIRIAESEAYIADIDFTQIEEGADEYVAPAVKGIFDLFGRRIEAPAATGIYIVDGKKRVIKK